MNLYQQGMLVIALCVFLPLVAGAICIVNYAIVSLVTR